MNGLVNAKEIHEIAKKVVAKDYDFDYVGLRMQEETFGLKIGDEITHESHHWNDGEMLEETTDGICAVDAKQASKRVLQFGAYEGNVILVIGANRAELGDDDGEIIMHSMYGKYPVILDIINA